MTDLGDLVKRLLTAVEQKTVAAMILLAGLTATLRVNPTTPLYSTPDSANYLKAAMHLSATGEYGSSYLYWPPLYPTLLAPIASLAPEHGIGYLNLFLLAWAVLASMLLARCLGTNLLSAAAVGVALAWSSPARLIYGMIWSETLILPLMLTWLLFWSRYLASNKHVYLIMACGFFGLCLLTRHASAPLLLTMLATLLWYYRRKPLSCLIKPIVGMMLTIVPTLLWLLRTKLISGTWTGPRTAQHVPLERLVLGPPSTLAHWLLPSIYLHDLDPLALTAGVLVIVMPCLAAFYVHRYETAFSLVNGNSERQALASTSLIFIISYLAFLVWAVLSTNLEVPHDRYLAPIFTPLLLLILYTVTCDATTLISKRLLLMLKLLGFFWLASEIFLQ